MNIDRRLAVEFLSGGTRVRKSRGIEPCEMIDLFQSIRCVRLSIMCPQLSDARGLPAILDVLLSRLGWMLP